MTLVTTATSNRQSGDQLFTAQPTRSDVRDGPALLRATRPYAQEDRARSWRLLATTLMVFAAMQVAVVLVPFWWAKILLSIPIGLIMIRMFIFYHDHVHGALFENSKAGALVMDVIGFQLLSVRSVWQETHDYHHRNNAKLVGSGIGSFPVVSTRMWRRMDEAQRRKYRALRHPAVVFTGYVTVFLIGMAMAPFQRNPKKHWAGPLALVLHLGGVALLWWLFDGVTAISMLMLPTAIATGLGSYLFYAQHNFPDVQFYNRNEWTFHDAALKSSSMFDMPGWLHWLTGNIGYHHIHHLNHRIPFYRLPEVMEAFPEFQQVGRTSWRLSDIRAAFAIDLWDPRQHKMVTFKEAAESAPSPATS